jgi:hypothetical protein
VRYLYGCQIAPIGRKVRIDDETRRPVTQTFQADTFALQRSRPGNIPVLVEHDHARRVGQLASLLPSGGWWHADILLDPEIDAELRVGAPVSVGLRGLPSGNVILAEVSIVRRPLILHAKIVSRIGMPDPEPRSWARPAGEVIRHTDDERLIRYYRTPIVRVPWMAQRRRKPPGATSASGWGTRHQQRRKQLEPLVNSGQADCVRCGNKIEPGTPWALDHRDDRQGYLGPAHRRCNSIAGAEKANANRGRQRERPYITSWRSHDDQPEGSVVVHGDGTADLCLGDSQWIIVSQDEAVARYRQAFFS